MIATQQIRMTLGNIHPSRPNLIIERSPRWPGTTTTPDGARVRKALQIEAFVGCLPPCRKARPKLVSPPPIRYLVPERIVIGACTNAMIKPAVFFDRDGVLNEDCGYLFEIHKFKWVNGAREAVKAVNSAGYFAFVVTNQSGVARGLYQEAHVHRLHEHMAKEWARVGAHIDAFEYCPDHPEAIIERYRRASYRRKPAPGMILDLLKRFPH